MTQPGLEFVSELSDLATATGMLGLTLAAFSLHVLALPSLAAMALSEVR